jgi:mannose-6-phosphate isomerase-like protein (cupin superfamily)
MGGMKQKINKDEIVPKDDACGAIRELYRSPNLTMAHVEITGDAKSHLHKQMEEIYYVTKGEGELVIGDKVLKIREGDLIPIPKNTYHQLRKTNEAPFEIIFVTYPAFDMKDVYFLENNAQ